MTIGIISAQVMCTSVVEYCDVSDTTANGAQHLRSVPDIEEEPIEPGIPTK